MSAYPPGGTDPAASDVHHYGPVWPEDITDIWPPGHCDYDCHPLLPRS